VGKHLLFSGYRSLPLHCYTLRIYVVVNERL